MGIFKDKLIAIKACKLAIEWVGEKSWEEAYTTCPRGDWMLWLFAEVNPNNKRQLTLAKAHCANTVSQLMTDVRSTNAIDVAIRYGNGEASDKELAAAVDAAADAYVAAAYAASAHAAADAADADAYVAAAYAAAAHAAADAAADAADAAAYVDAYVAAHAAAAHAAAAYAHAYVAADAAAAHAAADAAAHAYVAAHAAAAHAAADAAAHAADAAAAYAVAEIENQKLTADICRKYLPIEIWNI